MTRLELTDIECNDAIKVIQYRDTPNTFFYIDPPYLNSDQGHYSGYTLDQFKDLLYHLQKIKGKFLMSSYPHEVLDHYASINNRNQLKHTRKIAVHKGIDRDKTEVLTANYDIHAMRDQECDPKRQKKRERKIQESMPKAYPLSLTKEDMHETLM
jgi:DNA adenine methylase